MDTLSLLILLGGTLPGSNSPSPTCITDRALDKLLDFPDIYLGEVHGSREAPNLLRCLVGRAIKKLRGDPLIVSLELPESARMPDSLFWHGMDGRASQEMWALVQYLTTEEKLGHVTLHFQYGEALRPNPRSFDSDTGSKLQELAKKGKVIAFGGNFHSRAEPLDDSNVQPAGVVAGRGFTHISVEAVEGGATWACGTPQTCSPMILPPNSQSSEKVGDVVDGKEHGHDYVFYLKRFTPSPPKYTDVSLSSIESNIFLDTDSVRSLLEIMMIDDQDVRDRLNLTLSTKANDLATKALIAEMSSKDARNLRILQAIVEAGGWPAQKVVGKDAAMAAFLVLQHAPLDLQVKYLPMLRTAVDKGQADGQELAYLQDRILIRQGKRQLYGTQVRQVPGTSNKVPFEIDDIQHINERRQALGMTTLEEYLSQVNRR